MTRPSDLLIKNPLEIQPADHYTTMFLLSVALILVCTSLLNLAKYN